MSSFNYITVSLCLICGFPYVPEAQFIQNPSFEGTPARHEPPPGWQPCDSLSTPDTQDGCCYNDRGRVLQTPSEGNTFISMVTRGNKGPNANTLEDCQTAIRNDLLLETPTYSISLDLAIAPKMHFFDIWTGLEITYENPVVLKVWLSKQSCKKEMLVWTSPPIEHSNWETYKFVLDSLSLDHRYLILQVDYATGKKTFGNVLIDNMRFELEGSNCRFFYPNAFSPNNDGLNEIFKPVYDCHPVTAALSVYNRWGERIFQGSYPNEGWDGTVKRKTAPDGTYVCIFTYEVVKEGEVIREQAKGIVQLIR